MGGGPTRAVMFLLINPVTSWCFSQWHLVTPPSAPGPLRCPVQGAGDRVGSRVSVTVADNCPLTPSCFVMNIEIKFTLKT